MIVFFNGKETLVIFFVVCTYSEGCLLFAVHTATCATERKIQPANFFSTFNWSSSRNIRLDHLCAVLSSFPVDRQTTFAPRQILSQDTLGQTVPGGRVKRDNLVVQDNLGIHTNHALERNWDNLVVQDNLKCPGQPVPWGWGRVTRTTLLNRTTLGVQNKLHLGRGNWEDTLQLEVS